MALLTFALIAQFKLFVVNREKKLIDKSNAQMPTKKASQLTHCNTLRMFAIE